MEQEEMFWMAVAVFMSIATLVFVGLAAITFVMGCK